MFHLISNKGHFFHHVKSLVRKLDFNTILLSVAEVVKC